eukprot:jgi/Mesen1/2841/ME000174S02097
MAMLQSVTVAGGGGWSPGDAACGVIVNTPGAPKHAGILAEPYRLTKFEIQLACSDGLERDIVFRTKGPDGQASFGKEVYFNYTQKGQHNLEVFVCPTKYARVSEDVIDDVSWCTANFGPQVYKLPVIVTYVRREIRSLPTEEREQYFNAIWIMANVTTEDGQKTYGPKYHNYYEFVAKHWAAVLATPCDLGHWGPALVTFHRLFTKEFENSIQSIYPHLSLPYWDYFIDAEMEDPTKSIMWSNDFYGSMHGDPNDDWIVKDGKFAFWRVPHGEEAQYWGNYSWGPEEPKLGPTVVGLNPYGFMRSPNNMNKGRYLTRIGQFGNNFYPFASYKNWTMCRDEPQFGLYSRCLDASSTHPALHMGVGGNSGLPLWEEYKDIVDCGELPEADCYRAFQFAQELSGPARWTGFFEGCITCDKKCASWKQDPSECQCECVKDQEPRCNPGEVFRRTMSKLFVDPAKLPGYTGDYMVNKTKEFAKYTLCAPANAQGDYYDLAASALDPLFWTHHAMLDRLSVGYKWTYESTAWTNMSFTFPSPDSSVYPDFLSTTNILEPALGNASLSFYAGVFAPGDSNPSGVCVGHGLYDSVARGAFSGVFDALPAGRPHTNWDVVTSLDHEMYELAKADYIYDVYQL